MLCIYMIISSTGTNKRENIEQIPKEEKMGEVHKAVSEQGGVEGQRKEVNVGNYVKTAAVGQLLKDLKLPADVKQCISSSQICSHCNFISTLTSLPCLLIHEFSPPASKCSWPSFNNNSSFY